MKALWERTTVIIQLLFPLITPSHGYSLFTKQLLFDHWGGPAHLEPGFAPCCHIRCHQLSRYTSFSQCVWAVRNIFKLHRKSCQCPPWSCIAIFCSSKRPAPLGGQWHMALVQMVEPLPWQAARYLGALFANLTFYFVSNREKCQALLFQCFLLFSFLGIQFSWNYFRVNGHWSRALTRCWQKCFCPFSLTHGSGEPLRNSPWYHKNTKNGSWICESSFVLFSQVFAPSTDFLLTHLIRYFKKLSCCI